MPSQIPPHWWGPFAIWRGGLAIWGGVAAGVATGLWYARRRRGLTTAHYGQYATFRPTFLYELIWNLALAGVLAWLVGGRRLRSPGVFALYVAGYSAFRIFEESLRIDYSEYVLGMRLNFWIATLVALAGLVWFLVVQRAGAQRRTDVRINASAEGAP